MKNLNYKLKIYIVIIIAIIMFSLKKENDTTNLKANEYMNYLNINKIRGGCFYMKGDTIISLKNY